MEYKIEEYKTERYKLFFIGYFLILLLVCFLRFPNINDEYKYIYLTDNMLERGNFMILKYFGQLYPDKPPLYFWILAFFRRIFRHDFYPIALLFGSLIPMFLVAKGTLKFLTSIWNEEMSLLTTTFFMTVPFVVGIGLMLRMDMLLILWVISSIYTFFGMYYKKQEITKRKILLMYIFILLGMLTKGIVGFLVPMLTFITFLLFEKRIRFFNRIAIWKGLIVILGAIVIWFVILSQLDGGKEYIELMFGRETITRIIRAKTHVRPIYFYISHTPLTFFALTPFTFWQIYRLSKDIKNFRKWQNIDKISFAWFVPNFLFFSICSGKLDIYLLPIYPAMVILSGRCMEYIWKGHKEEYGSIIMKIQFILVVITVCVVPYYTRQYTLQKMIKKIHDAPKVYSYKFGDAKHLYYEINEKQIIALNDKNILDLKKGDLVLTKNENKGGLDLSKYDELSRNKEYTLLKVK